jgi:hypothetical protein
VRVARPSNGKALTDVIQIVALRIEEYQECEIGEKINEAAEKDPNGEGVFSKAADDGHGKGKEPKEGRGTSGNDKGERWRWPMDVGWKIRCGEKGVLYQPGMDGDGQQDGGREECEGDFGPGVGGWRRRWHKF